MYDVYKKIAEVLVKRGIGKSPEPTPFAEEDLDRYLGVTFSFSKSNSGHGSDKGYSSAILVQTVAASQGERLP